MDTIPFDKLKQKIKEKGNLIVALITADWCEPCKSAGEMMMSLEKKYTRDHVEFVSIDLDRNPMLTAYFSIKGLPSVIVFHKGVIKGVHMGLKTKEDYMNIIQSLLHPDKQKEETKDDTHTVKVFSTPTCPYCTMAKQYLSEKGVPYEDINVAADQNKAQEMVTKSGEMGAPQLWIDDQVVVGFNKPEIDRLLGL